MRPTAAPAEPVPVRSEADGIAAAVSARLAAVSLGITGVFALMDLALLPSSTIAVSPRNYAQLAEGGLAMSAGFLAGWMVERRFRNDARSMGRFVHRLAVRLMACAKVSAIFVLFMFCAALFMYLASNVARPLVDDRLAAADAVIGFDWVAFLRLTNESPRLAQALVFAYLSTTPILAVAFIVLSFVRSEERVMELMALVAVTSLATGILVYLFPAVGAYAWFHPARDAFGRFSPDAGMWHARVLFALRSREPFTYVQSEGVGLVTFPSFHTILGIVTTYCLRGIRVLFPVTLVLNALMIVATLPEGGHYLIDLVVGAIIAVACIVLVRRALAG